MKYLNLTEGFNPYNASKEDCIEFESFFFNGGEPHIKLLNLFPEGIDVTITSRLTSMNEFMMLLVATEALQQCGYLRNLYLFIPYFPGARQDRRMVEGEPLTVKVFSNLINDINFDSVTTFNNHSDTSTALINNCTNLDNHKFVENCLDLSEPAEHILVSPDAGALKKAYGLAKYLQNKYDGHEFKVLECGKTRDVKTGQLSEFKVYNDELLDGTAPVYICDDIIDGGGTFIGLAKELKKKNAGDIYLIVSHGIFSKPLKELKPYFKKIYTTDSWRSEFGWEQKERDTTDLVEIVEFKEFM